MRSFNTASFEPTGSEERKNHLRTLKSLVVYLWPLGRLDLKIRVILALASLAMAKVVTVYVPFLYKEAVDQLSIEDALLVLPLGVIFAYGGARLLQQAFVEFRDFIFVQVSQHAQREIALSTFRHVHRLSLKFHLERQTGGLSRVIERGVGGIQFLLRFILFNILPILIEITMVTVILFVQFDWRFSAVTAGTIVAYVLFTQIITDWRLQFRRTMNTKDSEANTKAIDSFLNFETVKYFNNEEHEYRRYDEALAGYEKAAVTSQTSLSLLNLGQGVIVAIGLVLVMWMAAVGVISGDNTIGDFVMVNTFLIQLYLPLNFLGVVYREIKRSLVDMDKMFELLEHKPDVVDVANVQELSVGSGQIDFENVSFGYSEEREILKNISFQVPPGKTVAIVGPSGSGKSTISRLLFRFYDVNQGRIAVDGQDIRDVSQLSLRKAIGVVPQDTVLFNDTIAYNIHYGNPEASWERVQEAAQLAQIHGFVESLPKGYETEVGERGLKLSGGEKQRVAIARTILKGPRILIFDEATSALDSHTEKEIQESLREVARERTTLIVAHRLSTIIDADEILVLRQGEIMERGRHEELLKLGGEYSEMWKKQQRIDAQTNLVNHEDSLE
jgi:ATP-binding cassette subfamily B protein